MDSDIDFLVVTREKISRSKQFDRTRGLFNDLPIPVQIIMISEEEFVVTRRVIGGIAYPAAKYGKKIYAKS